MPQRITCHGCHHVLYGGTNFASPDKIIHKYAGVCPKCNRTLSFSPLTIKIKHVNK